MLWLKHHCPICGIDIEKESGIKRFGKYFCSFFFLQFTIVDLIDSYISSKSFKTTYKITPTTDNNSM